MDWAKFMPPGSRVTVFELLKLQYPVHREAFSEDSPSLEAEAYVEKVTCPLQQLTAVASVGPPTYGERGDIPFEAQRRTKKEMFTDDEVGCYLDFVAEGSLRL